MRIWVKTGDISRELSPYLEGDYVGVDEVREGLRDHDVRVDDPLGDEGRPQLWRHVEHRYQDVPGLKDTTG